ncbi:MAG TPA: IS21 family transposase [Isosphaeraceae bacterium]|nr:IS21 family transposase [Isosphaeraceae bacterium]
MIDLETVNRIRHLHHAEHWTVGTIAADLGLHHETVEDALRELVPLTPAPRSSGLDPYLEFLQETLREHPRLRATRLWRMLKERGCTLTARQVRRRVEKLRPPPREAFLRRRVFVAEEAQVDWASFGHVLIGRARRALSAFLMVLSYSRMLYLEFFFDQTLENFLRGHVRAFSRLGVARHLLYDNLKAAVLERHRSEVRFNPRLLELASHYHFAPRACRPARGNEKGRVEKAVRFVRDSFFAARPFTTLRDFNHQAEAWVAEIAQRPWPEDDRKTVADAFAEESPRLLALPVNPFDTDLVLPVRSGKTIYIRFDLNDYTIPHTAIGRALTVVASDTTVRILDGTQEVSRHRRLYDRHEVADDNGHAHALLEEKGRARGSTPSARLIDAVPAAEAFLDAAFQRGESVASLTEKLLLLLDDYGAKELDIAVREALASDTPRLGSVSFLAGRRRRQAQRTTLAAIDLSRRPDLKDLYVKPHAGATYDELSRPADKKDDDDHE